MKGMVRGLSGIALAIVVALWSKRRAFTLSLLVIALASQLLILLVLGRGFAEPPNYLRLYDLLHNAAVIWRSTPAVADALRILQDEPIFEVGRRAGAFRAVVWSYQATVHAVLDMGLIVLALATSLTVSVAVRERGRACRVGRGPLSGPASSVWSAALLGLIGTGTGAACCGAMSVSLLATALGASAQTAFFLSAYEGPLIAIGYTTLVANLLVQGVRLHRLRALAPGTAAPAAPAHIMEKRR